MILSEVLIPTAGTGNLLSVLSAEPSSHAYKAHIKDYSRCMTVHFFLASHNTRLSVNLITQGGYFSVCYVRASIAITNTRGNNT